MRISLKQSVRTTLAAVAAVFVLVSCSGDSGPTVPPAAVASVLIGGAPTENVLVTGATVQLTAQPRDAGGASLTRAVTWQSSDNGLATVSSTGLVTGVAAGSVTITANSEGVNGFQTLSVRSPITVPPATATTPTTTTVLGGAVTLTIPPAATSTTTTLTVAPTATVPTDSRVLAGATFDFGPSGTVFTTPITLALGFNPSSVPVAKREDLRINLVGPGGTLTQIGGGSVDLVNNRVVAPVTHFSTYTIVVPADAASMTKSLGDAQTAQFSTAVAQRPTVVVRDAQNRPVPLANVTFAVVSGGGSITGAAMVETDTAGVAALPGTWVLGPTPGANSLSASIAGTAVTTTFTATATAPATVLAVTQQPMAAVSGVAFSQALVVAVRDQFGGLVANATSPVTAALISGTGVLLGTTTVNAVNGVATFSTLQLNGSGPHRLGVTSFGLAPDTTDAITVMQQVAALAITTQPAGAVSNIAFTTQPVVELRDNAGLRVIGGTAAVAASRNAGPGTLYGTTIVAAVDGVATFTNLGIEGAGSFSLRFDVGATASATSASFEVAAGTPGIRLRVGDSPSRFVNASATLDFPIIVDLSNRGTDDLASLTTTVTWDTARFTYVSNEAGTWQDAQGGAATVLVNDAQAAAGSIAITGFTTNATTATFTLRNIRLTAKPTGSTTNTVVAATVGTAGNAAGSAITVTPRALIVTVVAP